MEGRGKKWRKREFRPDFLRSLPICSPFEQETLSFKPWGRCVGRRAKKREKEQFLRGREILRDGDVAALLASCPLHW